MKYIEYILLLCSLAIRGLKKLEKTLKMFSTGMRFLLTSLVVFFALQTKHKCLVFKSQY